MNNTGTKFTFWDFLVDVIPGIIALLLLASILPRSYLGPQLQKLPTIGVGGLFILIVVGYVVGWVVQAGSRRVDVKVLSLIDHTDPMDSECEKVEKAQENGEWHFQRRYFEGAQVFFDHTGCEQYEDIAEEFKNDTLKNLTQSYVLDNDLGRMHRFKVLYIFLKSLYVLFALGAIAHAGLFLLQMGSQMGVTPNYIPALGSLESLGLMLFLVIGCPLTFEMRKFLEISMVKSMMGDFYTAELIE